MDLIRTPADLRPGDIMFGPIGGAVGLGVKLGQLWLAERFRAGEVSIDHVAIVVEEATWGGPLQGSESYPPRLVQAMPSGAEEVDFTFQDHWTKRHAYVRLPEEYPGQGEDAAAVARLFVQEKVPYSFASYLALGLWRWGFQAERLERWIDRRRDPVGLELPSVGTTSRHAVRLPCEAICSVLVDQAWSLAGKRVMDGVARQCVTPGALALQLWRRPRTTWALPAGVNQEAGSWVVS